LWLQMTDAARAWQTVSDRAKKKQRNAWAWSWWESRGFAIIYCANPAALGHQCKGNSSV